jgi:hypothetical protein
MGRPRAMKTNKPGWVIHSVAAAGAADDDNDDDDV